MYQRREPYEEIYNFSWKLDNVNYMLKEIQLQVCTKIHSQQRGENCMKGNGTWLHRHDSFIPRSTPECPKNSRKHPLEVFYRSGEINVIFNQYGLEMQLLDERCFYLEQ